MYFDEFKHQLPDIDPDETSEWLASFDDGKSDEPFDGFDAMQH